MKIVTKAVLNKKYNQKGTLIDDGMGPKVFG